MFFKSIIKKLLLGLDQAASVIRTRCSHAGIALIRLDNIGDFILWLDTAKEYRRIYPNQKITLIANEAWAEFAQYFPYWNEVWSVQLRAFGRNPIYRWSIMWRVRRAGFATAIQPTFSRVLKYGDSLIRATAAKHRIGSTGDLANISEQDKARSNRWYTQLLPSSGHPMMELDRNAEFLSQLTGKNFSANLPRLPVFQTLPEVLQPLGDYFILFPGASWCGKQWPVSAYAELLVHLQQMYSWHAVLCGSQLDVELCESIVEKSGKRCMNFAGRTSLVELTELIRGAQLLVGNDTSAVHISAAVYTPTVSVLGGGHYGRFMPYPSSIRGQKPVAAIYPMACFQCNWECTQPHESDGPVSCIRQVSVSTVLACVQQALAQKEDLTQ